MLVERIRHAGGCARELTRFAAEVARFDPGFRSFRNINTPEDYFRFRDGGNFAKATDRRDGYSWTDRLSDEG